MDLTHDTTASLRAAVALVNSAEELSTQAGLDGFFAEHRYSGRPPGGPADLDAVRELRRTLRELLTGDRDEAVRIVNRLLARHHALPQLDRHDGWDYHLHAVDPDAPFATRVAVESAMAMTDLIRADELSRLSVCADPGCGGIVLDLSRNRSRRFCSTACGNRAAAAAYRARRA